MLKDVSSVLESSVPNSKEIEIEAIDLSSIVYGCTWREISEPNSRDSWLVHILYQMKLFNLMKCREC